MLSRMQDQNSTPNSTLDWTRLDDVQAVDLLLKPLNLECYFVFIRQEKTIAQASKELDIKLNAVAYRVKRLHKHGLLKVIKTQKHHGKNLKVYTACGERLFIPLEGSPEQSLETLLKRETLWFENLITQAFIRVKEQLRDNVNATGWGIRLYRDEVGELQGDLAISPEQTLDFSAADAPTLVDIGTTELMLDFEDAKRLQKALEKIEQTYRTKKGAQRYIFRAALAPLPADIDES